jgi:hypothetical protein
MRITGNGRLVEVEETETKPYEEDECWIRIHEPQPSKGIPAVYAWCWKGEPVYPQPESQRES